VRPRKILFNLLFAYSSNILPLIDVLITKFLDKYFLLTTFEEAYIYLKEQCDIISLEYQMNNMLQPFVQKFPRKRLNTFNSQMEELIVGIGNI